MSVFTSYKNCPLVKHNINDIETLAGLMLCSSFNSTAIDMIAIQYPFQFKCLQ